MSELAIAAPFEVGDYLERRMDDPGFVMVEIGHGQYPVVDQQAGGFAGQQAYIGIEAGMRGRVMAEIRAEELRLSHRDMNAFFLLHDLGDGAVVTEMTSTDSRYEGEYDARTILPDEAADEVVASNVFCDPLIARDFGHTMALLGEMSRLVTREGMIILRETITPGEAVYAEYAAKHNGLDIKKKISPEDATDWENLELFFGTHKDWNHNPYPNSYYLFLAKAAAA